MKRSDIFISYRRANKDFTKQLDQALKAEGFEVWVDWEDIPPGAPDFTAEIQAGIEGADVFIPVLSPEFLESEYCLGELELALEYHKRVIPVIYNKFDRTHLPREVRSINWIYFCPHVGDANEFDDAFPLLLEAIRADRQYITDHTRYLLRAREWEQAGKQNRSFLLHGNEIDEAERWLATSGDKDPSPLNLHTEYIFASRANQRRQQRRLTLSLSFAFVIAIALALFSAFSYLRAEEERRIAIESEARAQSLLWSSSALDAVSEDNTRLALPLAIAANRSDLIDPPALSQQALASASYAPGPRRVFPVNEGSIWSTAHSADNRYVVGGTSTGEFVLWEVNASATANTPPNVVWQQTAHEGSVWDVKLHPEGDRILTAGADGYVRIWDIAEQTMRLELEASGGVSLWSMDVDTEGRFIAAGGVDGSVYIWEMPRGELIDTLDSYNEQVWAVAFNPTRTQLAAGGSDGIAMVWSRDLDTNQFEEDRAPFEGHRDDIWTVKFSPSGTDLLTGSGDGTVIRWDVLSGARYGNYQGHDDRVLDLEYDTSGTAFLSTTATGRIYLWNINSNTPVTSYFGHTGAVWDIERMTRGRQFISASSDGSVILWDMDNGAELDTVAPQHGAISAIAFSEDGEFFAYGTEAEMIVKRSLNGSELLEFPDVHTEQVNDLVFINEGRQLITAGDKRVLVWEAQFGPTLQLRLLGHENEVQAVAYYDGETPYIFSGGSDNRVIKWDPATGARLASFAAHDGSVWDLDVNTEYGQLVTGGSDWKVKVWDVETTDLVMTLDSHTDVVRAVAFSPNGEMVISGGNDRVLILYDFATDEEWRFPGHEANITSVAFSPDNRFVASGDENGEVIIWDLNGDPIRRYQAHQDSVSQVRYDPTNPSVVLSASLDGTIRLWRADDLTTLLAWTSDNRNIRLLNSLECENYQLDDSDFAAELCEQALPTPESEVAVVDAGVE